MAPILFLLALAGTVVAQAHGDNDTSPSASSGGGHRAVLSSASSRAAASATKAGSSPAAFTPLANLRFTYPDLPYKAQPDSETSDRGPQVGYNICNSTTQNQQSMCQTAWINSIDDFCLWAPPNPGEPVGNIEGEMVAWCTKEGHGTRIIPAGALTAVQFMRTPSYLQVTGRINQAQINILADDSGGEMDPHGADARGNPIGGLVYSNRLPQSNGTYTQVVEWHNFMGGNVFCIKACDPADSNDARYCEHIFDRIGCQYNAPAAYRENVFESCEGENQDFPGVYTENGQVRTYAQPPEQPGGITFIPYTARIPASSSCTTYQSSEVFTAALALASSAAANSSSAASSGPTSSGASASLPTGSPSARPSSGASNGGTGAANSVVVSGAFVAAAAFAGAALAL